MAAPSQIACEFLRTPALFLFFGRLLGGSRSRCLCRRRRRVRITGHAFLEAANAFTQSLHDFGDAPAAKENQHNGQNDQPMKNTELTHELPPRAPLGGALLNPSAGSPARQVSADSAAYRITRSSPARRVTRSRSRYSSSGMAYFRLTPVKSLNLATSIFGDFDFSAPNCLRKFCNASL